MRVMYEFIVATRVLCIGLVVIFLVFIFEIIKQKFWLWRIFKNID